MHKPVVFIVLTTYQTYIAFIETLLRPLSSSYKFYIITNLSPSSSIEHLFLRNSSLVGFIHIPFSRSITPFLDIRTLFLLSYFILLKRPQIVHSITPKAGLISGLTSLLPLSGFHIHTFTGQVWVTKTGLLHHILKTSDKIISFLSQYVLADSHSQARFLHSSRICSNALVLGNGSISGVDSAKFFPDPIARRDTRIKLSIPLDSFVFIFVGRLTYDKGILDLITAFSRLLSSYNTHLLLVGPDEDDIVDCLDYDPNFIHFVGSSKSPQHFMNASDVFCLPSYREGFGTSIIEAAACSVPAIGSKIYGISDAIDDCFSGLLHSAGDVDDIYCHMKLLISNPKFYSYLSLNAHSRALKLYNSNLMSSLLDQFYGSVLAR